MGVIINNRNTSKIVIGSRLSLESSTIDPEAAAYIAGLEAAGVSVSDDDKNAYDAFYIGVKEDGDYSLLTRLHFPVHGVVAANALCMVSGTSGTFSGGVTHASGYVQGNGTTGKFVCGTSDSLGITTGNGCLFQGTKQNDSNIAGSGVEIGRSGSFTIGLSNNGGTLRTIFRTPSFPTRATLDSSLSLTAKHIRIGGAYDTDARFAALRSASGFIHQFSFGNDAGSVFPGDVEFMGGAVGYTDEQSFFYGVGDNMGTAVASRISARIQTLYESITGDTL